MYNENRLQHPKKTIKDITRAISGWVIEGKKGSTDQVVQNLIARIERLESKSEASSYGVCRDCDAFLLKSGFLFHYGEKVCLKCFDYAVMDHDGINPKLLAGRILQMGMHIKDPERFKHIAEHVDCGFPGDDDYVSLLELMQMEAR